MFARVTFFFGGGRGSLEIYVHVCPISLHKEITFSTYSLTGSDVGIDHGWNHAYTMNLIQMDVVILSSNNNYKTNM